MSLNSPKKSNQYRWYKGDDEIARVRGRWGSMFIDFQDWEVASYRCRICSYTSVEEEKTHQHISEEHETREKIEQLADEFGFDDDSRIDRFKKVMQTMGEVEWADVLTKPKKNTPVNEVSEMDTLTG